MTDILRLGSDRRRDRQLRFYFFLLPQHEAAQSTRYQHPAIALGEGFRSLGIPFVSNVDHWLAASASNPLFRSDPGVDPYTCSAVFFTSDWLDEGHSIPPHLFDGADRPITVYLDHEDGSRIKSLRPGFPKFDLVLKAHYSATMPFPASFRPWAFGLTDRIIEATRPRDPIEPRLQRLLVSYRHSAYPHAVRKFMDRAFLDRLDGKLDVDHYDTDLDLAPRDATTEHLWRMTGRRHSSHYYAALRQSAACACFGGYFIPRVPSKESHVLSRLSKRVLGRFRLATSRIVQFDSWRLWESLAAGCASIHLDFDRYAARFPVMPRNWEHYIGLDLKHLDRDITRMTAEAGLLERIGQAGREWSLAHYGPAPTARRFLDLIDAPREHR